MAMRSPRLVISALLVALPVVFAAGCDASTPAPGPTPVSSTRAATRTASSSPEPSALPTMGGDEFDASVPPEPTAGLEGPPSEESAGEAARYFLSLFPYIFATGDLTSWRTMSGSDCGWCSDIADVVDANLRVEKRQVGGAIEFVDVQAFHHREDQYSAVVLIKEGPSRFVDASGAVVEAVDYTLEARVEMLFSWTGDGWMMDGVEINVLGKS